MQDAGYAALQIIPSFKGFQPALERGSSGALIAAGTSGGRKYGDSAGRSMASAFASHARTAGLLAAGGLAVAGAAIFKLGKDSLAEAREAQKVGALTTQVIKSTGGAANITAREVGNLSNTLSLKTGVDDEVIQRGANMLLTFKNIRNEVGLGNDVFNQSVQVTEDMAASMAGGVGGGQLDLKSSSILVGKALNDPIKGVTALTRVGVSFTDQQKKTIESLEKQGKASAAQGIVLKELKSEFGGAAAAQATMGEKVDVAWGNIQERLGTAILPLVHDVQRAILNDAVPALNHFADWFQHDGVPAIRHFANDAKPQIRGFIQQTKPLAEELLPAVSSALGDVRDVAHDALPYVKDLIGAFNDMPDWAKKGVALGGLGALAGKKLGVGSLLFGGSSTGGALGGLVSKASPVPVLVTNPGFGSGLPGTGGTPKPTGPGGLTPLTLGSVALGLAGAAVTGGALVDAPGDKWYQNGLTAVDTDKVKADTAAFYAKSKAEDDYRAGLIQTAALFKTLPATLQTKMVLEGVPESRKQALDLAKTYDLTKKQRLTLFMTSGIPLSNKQVGDLLKLYNKSRNPVVTPFSIAGINDAESRLASIQTKLNQLRYMGIGGDAPSSGSGGSGGGGSPSSGGGNKTTPDRPRGRTALHVHIGDHEIVTMMDERVYSERELDEERQRAGAGR